MKTYQDLLDVGQDEKARMEFVLSCINAYKGSEGYRKAVEAKLYYSGENPTINRYEKLLYDFMGQPHVDLFSANHKIASQFFGFDVNQEVSYLLGNGVTFADDSTKDKLGEDFDLRLMDVAPVRFYFFVLRGGERGINKKTKSIYPGVSCGLECHAGRYTSRIQH